GRGRSPRWLVGDEERRDWLGEGGGAAERRSGCLQGWANGNCGYYPHFPWSDAPVARRRRRSRCTMCHLKLWTLSTISLVRLTGGSSTRAAEVRRSARRRRGCWAAAGIGEQVVCYTTWLRTVSAPLLEWGLLSVAVARVEPERAGAWLKAWFSISFPYRKLGSGTNRTSPSGSTRKRHR